MDLVRLATQIIGELRLDDVMSVDSVQPQEDGSSWLDLYDSREAGPARFRRLTIIGATPATMHETLKTKIERLR